MSWVAPPFVRTREFYALARETAGWTSGEVDNRMASVFRRAQDAAAGRVIEWNGRPFDPRYRFRASTIVEWLRIAPREMREGNLRVLVDRDVARERAAERQRAKRRRAGVQERVSCAGAAAIRAQTATDLRSSGLSWTEVASEMRLPSPEAARKLVSRRKCP
jgi:hypothetical protein